MFYNLLQLFILSIKPTYKIKRREYRILLIQNARVKVETVFQISALGSVKSTRDESFPDTGELMEFISLIDLIEPKLKVNLFVRRIMS